MSAISAKSLFIFAAASGCAAVLLGAFGAHGLKGQIDSSLMQVYQTAVQYHFYHTLSLLFTAAQLRSHRHSGALRLSGLMFCLGILIFSGSLYALALSGLRWLGMVTPIGGLAFIIAWLAMGVFFVKDFTSDR